MTTVAGDVAETASAARGAGLATAQRLARRDGADRLGETLHNTRSATGALADPELPTPSYDDLTATLAASRTSKREPDYLRTVLNYEQAHKDRSTLTPAIQRRPDPEAAAPTH